MITPERRPTLVVIAGPNGSGKTSITEALLRHHWLAGCRYINPDLLARDVFGDWNSSEAVLRAAELAQREREECLVLRRSFAFETVLSAPDKLAFLGRAKATGFFLRVFFVCTAHPSINAARVAQRVMGGGHDVPISKIVARYTKSVMQAATAVALADRAYVFDNSRDGEEPLLLFRAREAVVEKVYVRQMPKWAQSILAGLSPQVASTPAVTVPRAGNDDDPGPS